MDCLFNQVDMLDSKSTGKSSCSLLESRIPYSNIPHTLFSKPGRLTDPKFQRLIPRGWNMFDPVAPGPCIRQKMHVCSHRG